MKVLMALAVGCLVGARLMAQGGRLGQMHAPVGQSEQLPPEVRPGAALRVVALTVQVVLEDGAPLDGAPLVLDSRIEPGVCRVANVFRNGRLRLEIPNSAEDPAEHDPRGSSCHLTRLMMPGYRSFSGVVRDGTVISLRRLGEHEGSTVSITSLRAPDNARKAYQRGEGLLRKQKWKDAQNLFERALNLYPGYAIAWSELGVALERQNLLREADHAFAKAVECDPKYIKPLVQRAALAGRERRWGDQLEIARRALKLHPVEFPGAYLCYAEASYQLGRLDDAEVSCRSAISVDHAREFPRAHFVMASILLKKGNPGRAAGELREFLRLAPESEEAGSAREQLARLE